VSKLIFINRYFAPDLSATSQMLSDLVAELAQQGVQICVVTSRMAYDAPSRRFAPRENLQGVEVYRVWTTAWGRHFLGGRVLDYLSFYLLGFLTLLGLLKRGDTLVAKTDPPLISIAAALAARLKGASLVNWLQDLFPEVAIELGVLPAGLAAQTLRRWRNWSLRQARCNVVIGSQMARRVAAEGVPLAAIKVIPNWADGALVAPVAPAANDLRRAWGLEGNFVVGYAGNLGRAHEFATLLGAAELLQGDARIVFLVIGGGSGHQQLQGAVAARGLHNVLFKPYQPVAALANTLSAPDVHLVSLLPALEGLIVPSKIYGIAAAGRPCIFIGEHSGEIARLLQAGQFGATVLPGDCAGLAAAIRVVASDAQHWSRWATAARAMFENTFTAGHSLAAWREVLNPPTSSPARPAVPA
jgi:colanic acid biosynthesis glycosyl transferase WcaI